MFDGQCLLRMWNILSLAWTSLMIQMLAGQNYLNILINTVVLESEQAPVVGDGQGSLVCCNPWGCKESDMTEQLTAVFTQSRLSLSPSLAVSLSSHENTILVNGYVHSLSNLCQSYLPPCIWSLCSPSLFFLLSITPVYSGTSKIFVETHKIQVILLKEDSNQQ